MAKTNVKKIEKDKVECPEPPERKEITITGVAKDTVKIGVGVVIGAFILNKIFGDD